jgi:phosphatidylglycerophosphate synthase
MVIYRTWVPNALSISRVPAALAFLIVYSSTDKVLYFSAIGIAFAALLTDIVDGPLARHWRVTSERGYFLDGLGDKAFYIAVLVTMIREQVTSSVLAWVLITREVFLYALRTLDQSRAENLKSLRFYSKAYALFIRLYFGCFLLADAFRLYGRTSPAILTYSDAWGYIAAALGVYSIFLLGRDIAQRM